MKLTAVVVLMVLTLPCKAQTAKASRSEQTHFSAEDESVQHPVEIPEAVLAIISKDESTRNTLEVEGKSQLPKNWLSASEVHLAESNEQDIVVMAVGLLRGANITTFWLFRPARGGYEMLLDAPVHDLIIKNSRSNGYRDIELLSATAVTVSTVILRFDGKAYQIYKKTSGPVR
jgi:hypothetical protein